MYRSLLTLVLFLLFGFMVFSQAENSALICADGIDNDNDGLVDCDDPDCDLFIAMGCATCFNDSKSFADVVIDYSPECFSFLDPTLIDPIDALGVPNHDNSQNSPFGVGRVTLGSGGSLTLGFDNNLITNSGDPESDVWVFEVGIDVEGTFLSFRPFDAATTAILQSANIPDVDNDGFYEFGGIGGATSALDLDAVLPGLSFGDIKFDAIKLVDDADIPCGASSAGADIDGVCALSSIATEICDNGVDDDNDGFVDCDDPDLASDCCCITGPALDLGPDISICLGESVTLDGGDEFVSYLWQDGTTTSTLVANLNQEYILQATDSCGVTSLDSVVISIIANDTVSVALTACEGEIIDFKGFLIDSTGDYRIIQSGNPCDSIFLIEASFFQNTSEDIEFSLCSGESTEINGIVYDQSGQFTQSLVNQNGCDSILNISVTLNGATEGLLETSICEGEELLINQESYTDPGQYIQQFTLANGCDSILNIILTLNPTVEEVIEISICAGDEVVINQETFSDPGQYTQLFTASNGCDSTLIILVDNSQELIKLDFENCNAVISSDENANYGEFLDVNDFDIPCGSFTASNMYRNNPTVNRHSCTPGVGESIAMCIGALDNCSYDKGNEKSLILELTLEPDPGESISLTCLEFFEKAPENFEWINGNFGPNNYPIFYGIRILKDGQEIFSQSEIETTREWTAQNFSFSDLSEFEVDQTTLFEIEILPYCLVDNGWPVSAWDIDELSISTACGSSNRKQVSGQLTSMKGEAIAGAILELDAEINRFNEQTVSNDNGEYAFASNPKYVDYNIGVSKNDDTLNGVTTLDLVLIQKHILGLEKFESPTQYIAADINNDKRISAIDLLELRKVILGINQEYPNNQSWKFYNSNTELSLDNIFDLEVDYQIESLDEDMINMDFNGVKIGDVNDSAITNANSENAENRSNQKLIFEIEELELRAGETYSVDFRANNFINIVGYQFTLDHAGLKINDIKEGTLDIIESNYNIISSDRLTMSWSHVNGRSATPQEALFTIYFTALKSGKLSDQLKINSRITAAESYDQNYTSSHVILTFESEDAVELNDAFELYQNSPNPFSNETTISFNMPENGKASLTIYDITGKVVYSISDSYNKGYNQINISKENLLNTSGIRYYRLESGINIATKKMIEIE